MLKAYREDDLHVETARWITKKEDIAAEERQLAKALNFGLSFGTGVPRLRTQSLDNYGVHMTEIQARRYREAFFQKYRGVKAWHDSHA
jgi:DNA polymerase I-like protein with 3'-5' exonuclease and polymerase domains